MSFNKGNITIEFNDVLRGDIDTEFHVFDRNFNTKQARLIIDEVSDKPVTGRLRGRKRISFLYTGEQQIATVVAIGLTKAQYISCEIKIDDQNHSCYMDAAIEVMYGITGGDHTVIQKMKEFFAQEEK